MFNKTKILVPALLLSLSCPVVLAQNRQQSASRNGQASEQQQQRRQASLAPWLVTIEHKINIEDLQRSLAKHGIKLSGGTNNQPVNVTTGIIVDNKGHILTRLLNINPNSKSVGSILVSLPSGETRPADFVGVDGLTGFCLLSIQGIDTTPAPIAERPELEMGSEVTFFDIQLSPAKTFRLQSLRPSTRNSDQLSFEARNEQKTGKITAIGSRENFIVKFETDTLQPTSTGFLIRDSKIVGIAESAESNIVRAFSAYQARLAAERILNHRGNVPRGWLGVSGRDLAEFTPEEIEVLSLGSNRGVLINVLPDSPAVAAGLRSGDIVLKIDGQEVNSLQKLASYIGLKTPGKVVEFEILRAKEPLKLNVSVGERPYSPFLLPDKAEQNAQRLHLEQEIASLDKLLVMLRQQIETVKLQSSQDTTLEDRLKDLEKRLRETSIRRDQAALRYEMGAARTSVEKLADRTWLGIITIDLAAANVNRVSEPLERQKNFSQRGVRVVTVFPNSVGEQIGLKAEDIITSMGSYTVLNRTMMLNLIPAFQRRNIENCDLIVKRGQELVNLKLSCNQMSRQAVRPDPATTEKQN